MPSNVYNLRGKKVQIIWTTADAKNPTHTKYVVDDLNVDQGWICLRKVIGGTPSNEVWWAPFTAISRLVQIAE